MSKSDIFNTDMENLPKYLKEKFHDHDSGVCPKTGVKYEAISRHVNQPAMLTPMGGDRYCSQCGELLPGCC
jgi:hypothetical protein